MRKLIMFVSLVGMSLFTYGHYASFESTYRSPADVKQVELDASPVTNGLKSSQHLTVKVISGFMVAMGLGMAGIWTIDIARGKFSGNFFAWEENDQLLWPHIVAEYLTAAGLIIAAIGLYTQKEWGLTVSLATLGALSYASLNSLAWAFKEKERFGYAVPMLIGLTGAIIAFTILII